MLDKRKKDFLNELVELETGKAQPLFHPFPVINIYRDDEMLEIKNIKEKPEEEKLLAGLNGIICDVSDTVKPEIAIRAEREGSCIISPEEVDNPNEELAAAFTCAMDMDASFLKYAIVRRCMAIKATYGLISRHGMETDAPSLAQPAVGAQNAAMCAKVLEAVAGVDNKDPMSRDAYIYEYTEALKSTDLTGMRIAIPAELTGMELDETQLACYNQMLDVLESKGAEIETVELDWIQYAVPVHEMIASCEKVMTADEVMVSVGAEDESMELGNYLLQEENYEPYYLKALKLRSLIKDSYDMMFRDYALFIVPFTEAVDSYSIAANLAGLPAMTIPYVPYGAETVDGTKITAGLHMIAGANYENNLIKAAYTYEQEVL